MVGIYNFFIGIQGMCRIIQGYFNIIGHMLLEITLSCTEAKRKG